MQDVKKRVVALVAGALMAAFGGHAMEIAKDGKPVAVIVHNGHTTIAPNLMGSRYAKLIKAPPAELQQYLKQITGAELPLVKTVEEAADKPAIVLDVVEKVPGASDKDTARDAYRITVKGSRLTLTASTLLGLHNAVYGLLEDHMGCRFYSCRRKGLSYVGPGFEVVPKRATLIMSEIDDLQEPAFANRGIIYWLGNYPWILKNRGIGLVAGPVSGALSAHHCMYDLIPPKDKTQRGKVTKGLFAEHPDFYPMDRAGKRAPTWAMGICGTNEQLPAFLAKGLEAAIRVRQARAEKAGQPMDWSLPFAAAQGDGFSGCQCKACRACVAKEQSESAPLILALNRTLDILNQTYPKARVITFAYFGTIAAPKTLKPHKNLMINVVSSDAGQNSAGDQMGLINGNPANRDYARALKEWPRIAPNRVTVWHWDSYRAEWPSMFYVDDNVRYFRDCSLYAVNPQFCGGPWVDLLAWLYLKLAWNPDLDGDKLIQQYVDDNFGHEAGKHVYAYLKLAQSGYADNLYVPSAVRWSGWTQTMRVKLWPPALLARMTAEMDKAMAAADAAGDKTRLANLIGARGRSLDVVNLNAVGSKPWGPVAYQGKMWFVAGADPLVPPALMRAKQGMVADGGGEHGILRSMSGYVRSKGGPLVELSGKAMGVAVCPDLKGQIVSAVDKTSGKELLAVLGENSGYVDLLGGIVAQIWVPVAENHDLARRANDDWSALWSGFKNPDASVLQTDAVLSPARWGFYPNQYVHRTVKVTDAGLRVERQFIQKKASRGFLRNPWRFSACWRLHLPDSKQTKVVIQGGGIDQMLDLRYAVAGGIKTVKAGEKLKGADWMDERIDTVIAVSDAKETVLPIKAEAGGTVVTQVDRGDGVAAVLTADAKGWDSIRIKPVIDKKILEVTLVGNALAMDGKEKAVDLPTQILTAKAVAKAKPVEDEAPTEAALVQAKVKKTGEGRAVNAIDGAALVWIPAGPFLRGSDKYADEKPQKTIHLDGYWIYKHPVTQGQYKTFCEATGKTFKPMWGQGMHTDPAGKDDDYAVQMNWYEAAAYAKWAGGSLPTEAQWEKAARGQDGREYPWGNTWDPAKCASFEETVARFSPGFMAVGSQPQGASPYGVEEMAGNVWEWVADWYQHDYYASAPEKNPSGPETGTHKVLRGGCGLFDERFSRCAARMIQPPQVRDWTPIGFRVVIGADNVQETK